MKIHPSQQILRGKGERSLDRNQIIVNSRVLVTAGSETTATLLSGVTYHLLMNPDKLARLQNEVRGAFSSPDEMKNCDGRHVPGKCFA